MGDDLAVLSTLRFGRRTERGSQEVVDVVERGIFQIMSVGTGTVWFFNCCQRVRDRLRFHRVLIAAKHCEGWDRYEV